MNDYLLRFPGSFNYQFHAFTKQGTGELALKFPIFFPNLKFRSKLK